MVVERMPNGMATLSETGLVLYCNPFLTSLLDVPMDSLVGRPLATIFESQDIVLFDGLLASALEGPASGELRLATAGGPNLVRVSITPLPTTGRPILCLIVTEMTDRELVARQEAEEASRLKDEFLATLSHELRTPLAAIATWSHVLRQEGLDSAIAARAFEAIDRNTRAQTAVVADLLDVSRIVTGKFSMGVAPVNLPEVIRTAAETLRPAIRIKGIALSVAIGPGAEVVAGDAARIRQIVWNLLSNAIRFAPVAGRVDVGVAVSGACIELRVTDDGPGIEPTFLPHVFERFRQADSSSTRRHAGLGLGLAIARHLVELHGGSIQARNREDRSGAVFIVRLPRPRPAA
jgi:signal transduction histidine kinase